MKPATTALMFLSLGCSAQPPLWPVAGKVLFADGSPVTHGIIEFAPLQGDDAARSLIGTDGSFVLKTGERAGAVAGVHRIAIVQTSSAADVSPQQHKHAKARSVPAKFRSHETSGLQQKIEPGVAKELIIRVEGP